MSRADLIKAISERGWSYKLMFGSDGPYLEVQGAVKAIPFCFFERVPIRLLDNHYPFWEGLCAFLLSKEAVSDRFVFCTRGD